MVSRRAEPVQLIWQSRRAIGWSRWKARRSYLAGSHALAGRHAEALTIVTPLSEVARQSHHGAVPIALAFAALDKTDQTMFWLEEAYKNHDFLSPLLNVWPRFDAVRADPRFKGLAHRIGIPSS
jgi:hypothetical protein